MIDNVESSDGILVSLDIILLLDMMFLDVLASEHFP
jgi:hypothetical protein